MKLMILMAVALMLPQEKNEAEELFKKMEAKLVEAKTVRLKMAGEMDKMKMTLAGTCLLGEAGKVRFDLEGKVGTDTMTACMRSDGKKVRLDASDKTEPKTFEVTEAVGKLARACIARGGMLGTLDSLDNEKGVKAEADALFALSQFKLGAKEKLGDRDAQAVEYQLAKKGHPATEATVWIDVETHLPLKRVLKKSGLTLIETYSDVQLDGKVDEAPFDLSK